jgi:LPS export ABC transporter permease LptF
MSVLVGILIGLSRMAADGEVIAARALGIGVSQFARPVMGFALAGWGLTLWMSLFLAPHSVRKLNRMESGLKASQIPYEIQPRVFIEQFPNLLLYLHDVTGSPAQWRRVFIADTTERDALKITLAETGLLVNEAKTGGLTLHLERGTTHEIDPQHPQQYSVISFTETAIPIPAERTEVLPERQTPSAWTAGELLGRVRNPLDHQAALVELHYRLALPVASLVLALVGIPLGMYTRKGGKAAGLILTIVLVFAYYILMAFGLSLSKQGKLHPAIGLWLANLIFAVTGVVLMTRLRRVRMRMQLVQHWIEDLVRRFERRRSKKPGGFGGQSASRPLAAGDRAFQILDIYVLKDWLFYFAVLLITFTGIYIVFDFFQLLGDMVRNHASASVVINYYRYLLPQVIYLMLPLSVLVATLVTRLQP